MEKLTEEAIMAATEAKRQGDDQRGRPRNLKDIERKIEREAQIKKLLANCQALVRETREL